MSAIGIARGMTWKRSFGTADGASATGSVPSIDSMSSRPSWKIWPTIALPWPWTASARRR